MEERTEAARPQVRSGITRQTWHFLVDVILLVVLMALAWVSAVLQIVFPTATAADGWSLWGWGYDEWSMARFITFGVFLVVALIHVMLQWNWVCSYVTGQWSKIRGRKIVPAKAVRTLYGVGLLITLLTVLGVMLAAAEFSVRPPHEGEAVPSKATRQNNG